MSLNLPTKSSSRAGRFKKKLVTPEALLNEAPLIEAKMAPILELFTQTKISAAELTAIYLVAILSHRFPATWLGSFCASKNDCQTMPFKLTTLSQLLEFETNIKARLSKIEDLGGLYSNFAFRSTPLSVHRSILEWSKGNYGLELMFRVPNPHEVLMQQKMGRRCVSVLTKKEQTSSYILGERDALSFTMHDLIHADHFYHDNDCFQGQLGFYGLLNHCLTEGHFQDIMPVEKFRHELEYLIADMNAYAVHLMKCFKSALIHYHPAKKVYFDKWIQKLDLTHEEQSSLVDLNTTVYAPETQDVVILNLLSKWNVKERN